MMRDNAKRFVLSAIAASAVVVGLVAFGGYAALRAEKLTWADYRANLRENEAFGCDTFPAVKPDILLIGDSHLYAAVDFNLLSEALGQSVSACAIGGFYAESLPLALERIEGHFPKTIVYAASLRQFAEGRQKARQIAGHRQRLSSRPICAPFGGDEGFIEVLRECGPGFLAEAAFKNAAGRPIYQASSRAAHAALQAHAQAIESIDERAFTAGILMNSPAYKDQWERRIREINVRPAPEQLYKTIGDFIREHGIRLHVIALPESPFLESMYPQAAREAYRAELERFRAIGADVVHTDARSWGIGNRHFVNRYLHDGYEYAVWNRPGFSPSVNDIDLDHMNPAGAAVFTRELAGRLGR